MASDEFDIHEYRRRRLATAENDVRQLTQANETLLAILAAVLTMCDRAGYPWQLVLDAAIELEGVDPGRMQRIL